MEDRFAYRIVPQYVRDLQETQDCSAIGWDSLRKEQGEPQVILRV